MADKKTEKAKGLRSGNPLLDPAKLIRLRHEYGVRRGKKLTQFELAGAIGENGVSEQTIKNWEAGSSRPSRSYFGDLLTFFGASPEELLRDETYESVNLATSKYSIEMPIGDWVLASNGLRYQVHKLRHNELSRDARGKRYDLTALATNRQVTCRSLIQRHPHVAYDLRNHPNIITSMDAFKDSINDFFWVVDEWIDGITLQRKIQQGAIPFDVAKPILLGMASGLQALHEQQIVLRDLSPATVLLERSSDRPVLTEFELAKLLDYEATVSPKDWPEGSGYRAEDATSDDVDLRADIYSWGRIATHVLLGHLPKVGAEVEDLQEIKLPKRLKTFIHETINPFRNERPNSFDAILEK